MQHQAAAAATAAAPQAQQQAPSAPAALLLLLPGLVTWHCRLTTLPTWAYGSWVVGQQQQVQGAVSSH
jgi:hypothetical protein